MHATFKSSLPSTFIINDSASCKERGASATATENKQQNAINGDNKQTATAPATTTTVITTTTTTAISQQLPGLHNACNYAHCHCHAHASRSIVPLHACFSHQKTEKNRNFCQVPKSRLSTCNCGTLLLLLVFLLLWLLT